MLFHRNFSTFNCDLFCAQVSLYAPPIAHFLPKLKLNS